ncbi:tryptophan 2-halogenase, partial [Triangularia verruculosa]
MNDLDIPERCTVLVVGGGPGGSYTAAVLAREGVDVVVLEGDTFPRYHIGESMLASMRHLLRFVELESKFDAYGFTKKPGAAFKLNKHKREGYTDFLAAGGPDNYAWNVVRSEADHLMLQHAGESGAKTFDGVQVLSLQFESPTLVPEGEPNLNPDRPVTATYLIKSSGTKGTIDFDYIVDASGRAGLLSTKYMKNRRYNQGLKNVAVWSYWTGCGRYAPGTTRENSPYFEALQDESGWAWFIPLHNGTTSVGVVMNQKLATEKKKTIPSSGTSAFYHQTLRLTPNLLALMGPDAKLSPDAQVKSASDYSYSASSYAFPYARIVGDAGCFIDPYFSSGVHLALVSGLSAATTICASLRGDTDEPTAAEWHSTKVADAYTRFLLVVLSAYKQIRHQDEPVLSDFGEDNFDRAFGFFRPVIQGVADASVIDNQPSQEELNKTLEFCAHAFEPVNGLGEEEKAVVEGVLEGEKGENGHDGVGYHPDLSPEQLRAVKHIRARRMMRTEDTMNLDSFGSDAIGCLVPNMVRGSLGLKKHK